MDTKNKLPPLVEPRFGYADDVGNPYKPTALETLRECGYVLDVFHNPSHTLTVVNFGFELLTLFILLTYVSVFWSSGSFVFLVALVLIFATVYNTIWYHRYCSHISCRFTSLVYARIILWSNPLASFSEKKSMPFHMRFITSEPRSPAIPMDQTWVILRAFLRRS